MNLSTSILIKKLVLVGHRKNYVTSFNPGVNIIYGDADTGKSSILELINYLFGAKKFSLYEEIESSVKFALLEVSLNEKVVCIKRDIFDASCLVEVYHCDFEEIDNFSPEKFWPNFDGSSINYGYYSDFLLESLNLPRLKIKISPSKDDSKMNRFSFRDLFKYCYINQDDLGSKRLLDIGNYALEAKNRETFKYIFNILDTQSSELQIEISDKLTKKKNIEQNYKVIAEFLRTSEFQSLDSLDDAVIFLDRALEDINHHISKINMRMTADNEAYRALKSVHDDNFYAIKNAEDKRDKAISNIQRYIRLKNDYVSDINKFKSLELAKQLIDCDVKVVTLCPVCDSQMQVDEAKNRFDIIEKEKINFEINTLNRRIKDLTSLIDEQRSLSDRQSEELKVLLEDQKRIKEVFDANSKDMITPYLAERDSFISEQASLKEKRNEYVSKLKLRNQHQQLYKSIEDLEIDLATLNEKLKELKENAPSQIDILSSLADELNDYLAFINIKNRTRISISERKFLPIVRDLDYQDINSGGLRTITSIGYFCSIFRKAKDQVLNIPPFLMIDTVGKYLGKTKASYLNETSSTEDLNEGMSDPSKYKNIYEYLIKLSVDFESAGKVCQIILVDNDVPPEIQLDYGGFVVAHFSSEGRNGLPVGLIDDADIFKS